MSLRLRASLAAVILSLPLLAYFSFAQRPAAEPAAPIALPAAINDMSSAARNFLASLSDEQRAKAVFDFKDEERHNWHFVPRARKGLSWKEMTPAQRDLAHALLSTGLGQRGYVAATTIMSLEAILAEIEKGRGPMRDPELYFVSIFGKPAEPTWAWRVEGHHLALNFTIINGQAVSPAPSFFGTNPAEVREGPRKGLRALDKEEDFGRALAKSLTDEQKKSAILPGDVPKDILTGNARKAMIEKPAGILFSQLDPRQQQDLLHLIGLYARRHRHEVADHDLLRIQQAGHDKIRFAWSGTLEPGQPHYYRIHGPTFLVEYDNTQNNANHIHTVWRDLENDFGDDLLKKHYEAHRGDSTHGHVAAK